MFNFWLSLFRVHLMSLSTVVAHSCMHVCVCVSGWLIKRFILAPYPNIVMDDWASAIRRSSCKDAGGFILALAIVRRKQRSCYLIYAKGHFVLVHWSFVHAPIFARKWSRECDRNIAPNSVDNIFARNGDRTDLSTMPFIPVCRHFRNVGQDFSQCQQVFLRAIKWASAFRTETKKSRAPLFWVICCDCSFALRATSDSRADAINPFQ